MDLDLKRKIDLQNGRKVARQNHIKGRRLLDAVNQMQYKCQKAAEGRRRAQECSPNVSLTPR